MGIYDRKAEVEKYGTNRPFAPKQKKNTLITPSQIKGEQITGYEPPGTLGEFECENCKFFEKKSSSCNQVTMVAFSKQPRTLNNRVKVDPEGCCEYVDRVGRKDKD